MLKLRKDFNNEKQKAGAFSFASAFCIACQCEKYSETPLGAERHSPQRGKLSAAEETEKFELLWV